MTSAVPESKNFEKNEAKRLAKLAKFNAKQAKQSSVSTEQKEKPKKIPTQIETESTFIETPIGDKKILSQVMPNAYDPTRVEKSWYPWWQKKGFFKPSEDASVEKFVIPIPPPNVTGSLHLGHALTNAIQDCMIRWNRMHGKAALFIPGTDHAGIATQIIVEKKLMRERNLTRHDLGREAFLKEVWVWKDIYGDRINEQLRRLGSSNDWDRVKFTMDPDLAEAVTEAFIRLHREKIIYRDNRLVNWCTKLKTALSNLEVDSKEIEGRTFLSVPDHNPNKKYEFGVIISFSYPIQNSDEKITVATTRLETMLGDTAVAVNPNDTRYTHLVGKFVVHPFNQKLIPIIADEYVDRDFGTGAVKITPAHDFNDYIVGKRHNLEFINIMTDDGKINENGSQFTGMQRFDARLAVLNALKEKGLYVETKDNKMILPFCGRSGNIVEPLMKPQWWVSSKSMAQAACEAVTSGELEIVPDISRREWFRWLENPQDWCISRQLWWGHQAPAYFIQIKGQITDSSKDEFWVSAQNEQEAKVLAIKQFPQVDPELITVERDPDVLDTWFSSALWPFSTLGWPNKTKDYELFYPNSLLETGWDILFFWVARMVMMGIKLTGKIPFKKVYCHAMVRDAHGRKMSKSLGNVIDPIDVIEGISLEELNTRLEQGNLDPKEVTKAKEGQKRDFPKGIPTCGADALRFTLLSYTYAGRDINLDVLRIEGYRKFCNKIWNATKFSLMKLGDDFEPRPTLTISGKETLAELYILSKLNKAIRETNLSLKEMNFMQATSSIYNFWLYEFCDQFIECSKYLIESEDESVKESVQNTLYTCLDQGLKLISPMMPYLTEELFQRIPRRPNDFTESVCISKYPIQQTEFDFPIEEANFEKLIAIIAGYRSLIADYSIKEAIGYYSTTNLEEYELLKENHGLVMSLLGKNMKTLNLLTMEEPVPSGTVFKILSKDTRLYLMVKGFIDIPNEITKLEKKRLVLSESIKMLKGKTSTDDKIVNDFNELKIQGIQHEVDCIQEALDKFMKLSE